MIVDERAETRVVHPCVEDVELTDEQNRVLHRTIMEVTRDIEQLQFNTAIARMMEFVNFFTKQATRPRRAMEQFVLLLSPFAPHIGEELWQALGRAESLAYESWPEYDESLTRERTIEVPVQVGKKVRARIQIPADATGEDLEEAARANEKIASLLQGKEIRKVIVVPGRLVNFVVK
jgi:leucyl-tRNA synthetase